jgi:hypothetical protein
MRVAVFGKNNDTLDMVSEIFKTRYELSYVWKADAKKCVWERSAIVLTVVLLGVLDRALARPEKSLS